MGTEEATRQGGKGTGMRLSLGGGGRAAGWVITASMGVSSLGHPPSWTGGMLERMGMPHDTDESVPPLGLTATQSSMLAVPRETLMPPLRLDVEERVPGRV